MQLLHLVELKVKKKKKKKEKEKIDMYKLLWNGMA
jgi:hypothetical protein